MSTPRTRVRRSPNRALYDRESVERVLDQGMVAHLAFIDEGRPYCIPMLHVRIGDDVLIHGATSSRLMKLLGAGAECCLTVTELHGLVLARSAFNHSVNYDAVVLQGTFRVIEGDEARAAAYAAFTDALIPGRYAECRPPSRKELKATQILAMSIEHAAVKSRAGGPGDDDDADAELDVWAGEVPIVTSFGAPVASVGLRDGIPVPASATALAE